ncbi:30S ribosomal protein S16 [Gleimia sp. 6138-11-ORH1]|uniref:30S ribosomal protein S16 n=1 Tax=Gleimia sp. 6138-11-ORH1 TaxID=2973937 RepID=UPI002166D806|nr:30S ribosomal protein S16 [Gleimia sp. 6138-11-ORH1]MCS4484884.1 30S ribosomal protein S16 [Gleimia sp. 6138-11-ORH1]
MAVRIRLKRMGKIHAPFYRVVVVDQRKKRDGRVIEEIGIYDPTRTPSVIEIKGERAQYWLGVGAQPSDQVLNLLKLTGDWAAHKGVKNPVSRVKYASADAEAAAKAIKAAEEEAIKRKADLAEAKAKEEAEKAAAAAAEEASAEEVAEEAATEEA